MRRELPSKQKKQRMFWRVAMDDPWVSTVSQRGYPRTNGIEAVKPNDDKDTGANGRDKSCRWIAINKGNEKSLLERGSDIMLEIGRSKEMPIEFIDSSSIYTGEDKRISLN
ncbi:hypothetical protein GW17_00051911 [Ensete ventricosum]|nr:hypothetical protein GW17_00051911 [Ensete ventricosum]